MRKARNVDSVDFGKQRSDGAYTTKSGGYGPWTNSLSDETLFSQLLGNHIGTLANAKNYFNSVPHLQQQEVFESTESKRPVFNDCVHTKLKTCCYPFSTGFYTSGLGRINGFLGWRFVSPLTYYSIAEDIDWSLISSNMQAEAYHTMIPRFEGEVSMLNFIFEMKDFRELSTAAFKRLPKIKEKYGLYDSLSRATKRLAEARLIKSFVVDPTVNDLKDIIKQAQSLVMNAQRDFAERGLSDQSRHFSKTLTQSQSLTNSGVLGSSDYFSILKGTKSVVKFTSTMEGNYGYTCRSDLEAFARYWGLQPSAEALFAAIPFSFLVDYIMSISKALNVMRHDPNVTYHMKQYCESILSTCQTGYFLSDGAQSCRLSWVIDDKLTKYSERPSSAFFTGTLSSKYERVVKSPYWGPFLPRLKVPTEGQALNTAALLSCLL